MALSLPSVSIVTPSYNQGRFIAATIDSVLNQNYPNVEYVVMDGGSTDQTVEILKGYGERIAWVSERDDGQSDALNKGFGRTRGEILGWLNSDDTYSPGAIAAAAEYFATHPDVAMVYGDADYIDATGGRIGRCAHVEPFNLHRLLYYSDFIVQPAAFFRRSAFEAVGGIDASLHFCMDYDLWLKIGGRFKMAYLPRVLANFRWFGGNKTAVGGQRRFDEIEAMVRRHGAPGLPAYVRLEAVRMHLHDGLCAAGKARIGQAASSTWRALSVLLPSGRALASLFSPLTWKIIWTGQVLRSKTRKVSAAKQR
ncbi:MAG TPA: glycosyltransferase family 2 protein [Tepidisphaeraceae bacterium]|jgi:hypothetical protein